MIISKGARLAEHGEFTKRAFLFNRIDLVNAESINDLINALQNFDKIGSGRYRCV